MKRTAYIGCLGMIGVITTEFGVIGILPQVAGHYHIPIEKAGMLLSAFAMVIALTGPFMTLFASGFDRKKVMLTAISIFLITGIVSSFAPPFWLLLIVRIMPAFLQPVYIAVAIAAATSGATEKKKNELIGIVMGGIAITMVTTVPFATYLASMLSWQVSFMVQAAVTLLALMAIWKGTTMSGWFIFYHGVVIAPWVGAAFGVGSLAMIALRYTMERKPKLVTTA